MTDKSSYRNILKATSLFGGVQIFQILITLVRAKLVAIFIGAAGMGINGLFNSSMTIVITLFGLGLNTSAVRDISQSNASGDIEKLSRTVKIFRICLYFCSIIGVIFLFLSSPFLSKYTFGNYEYVNSFFLLSIMLVASLLSQGYTSVLQGTRRLKDIGKSTIIGSIISLLISIPLFYFFRIKGIVPVLILSAVSAFIVNRYYANKVPLSKLDISRKDVVGSGKEMAKLGIVLVTSNLIGYLCIYLTNTFISKRGGISDLGFYQAAMSMTNQAVGLIFAAMGSEYYPRLIAVCDDKISMNNTVNQQGEILLLIAFPILMTLMIFAKIIIYLLLSPEFYIITDIIRVIVLGMILKIASYSIGYISLAKGNKKIFLIQEGLISNLMILLLNISGYLFGGLAGLAISFIISYILYFTLICFIAYKYYQFRLSNSYLKIFVPILVSLFFTLLITRIENIVIMYIVGNLLIAGSCIYSFRELDHRIDMKNLLLNLKKRIKMVDKLQ